MHRSQHDGETGDHKSKTHQDGTSDHHSKLAIKHSEHHKDHRKSFFNLIPHHDFLASDSSEDETRHVPRPFQKKPRSKRYFEHLREARRNRFMASNKTKLERVTPEDECKDVPKMSNAQPEKGKQRPGNVTDQDANDGSSMAGTKRVRILNMLKAQTRPVLQPYIVPPRVIIRSDGVKIFPRNPILMKPKAPRPFTKAEIQLRQRCSNLVIAMPVAIDEADRSVRATNRLVQKIIRYIKRSWFVRANRKNSLLEISHRLNQRMYHARTFDSWVKRRKRELIAERTGFYSSNREHYVDLGNLETDTAMLVLRNLPTDLRITPTRWLRAIDDKNRIINKRDTPLPKVPRARQRRPSYSKGRVKLDAGGQRMIDDFVKVAEMYQRSIRGTQTYSHLIEQWRQHRGDEATNRASPFGILRRQNIVMGDSNPITEEIDAVNIDNLGQNMGKRDTYPVDDREMHYFEKMMCAMYDIIKSLLNISQDQVTSKLPLSHRAVLVLRDRSPDAIERAKRKVPLAILKNTAHPELYTAATSVSPSEMDINRIVRTALGSMEEILSVPETEEGESKVDVDLIRKASGSTEHRRHYHTDDIPFMHDKKKAKPQRPDFKEILQDPTKLTPGDIMTLSPPRSSRRLMDAIKMAHSLNEIKDHMSAEKKINSMFEDPKHTMLRAARNEATYLKLFHHGKKSKKPIWHRVRVGRLDTKTIKDGEANGVTSLMDTTSIVERALKKRGNMNYQRFPDEDDIPTPNLPGATSKRIVSSEEQSRLNLLKKIPEAAKTEPPSTPIRRLYRMAGVKTTEKEFYQLLMEMKRPFRNTENKLKILYENEIDKFEWETLKRYKVKLKAITSHPIYQKTISIMRRAMLAVDDDEFESKVSDFKRAAPWYRKLITKAENMGAFLHHGCHDKIVKLQKYCDVDRNSKPHMLSRCCLLVVSLPVTELGEPYWQAAITFILEELLGAPVELFHSWLLYRNLPYIL